MPSQDSEGESYVVDLIANPKSYGDEKHYSLTSEEDEDESIPPRFKNESMEALFKRIIKLEIDNCELMMENFTLSQKLKEAKGKSPIFKPPPSSSPPKEN